MSIMVLLIPSRRSSSIAALDNFSSHYSRNVAITSTTQEKLTKHPLFKADTDRTPDRELQQQKVCRLTCLVGNIFETSQGISHATIKAVICLRLSDSRKKVCDCACVLRWQELRILNIEPDDLRTRSEIQEWRCECYIRIWLRDVYFVIRGFRE